MTTNVCSLCRGSGYAADDVCPECDGAGVVDNTAPDTDTAPRTLWGYPCPMDWDSDTADV